MAVRRGVWVVVFLLVCAVLASATLVTLSWVAFRRPPGVPAKGVLVLKIEGGLDEISNNPFDALIHEPVTVRSLTQALRAAKTDPRITGVLLRPIQAPALWGKVQEVREALVDFRSSGKPLVALVEFAGDREYVLASAASRVVLVPPGQLNLTGLASYQVFLRGTFDLIGAQPDLLHIGDYKTAVNTFTEKGFTPAHKEMTESLNHDAFEQLLGAVASARKKSVEDVRALIDQGPMLPDAALANGLVDDVAYFDEIGKTSGLGDRFKELPLEQYLTVMPATRTALNAPRIAVIYAVGTIVSGNGGTGPTGTEVGSDKLTEYIRDVRNDDSIKAAVLRIDSPGGSTVASDVIWRELMLLRARKPLVVSMSDLAASGGYYIAMPGPRDRGPARDADGIDRDLLGQVRHRRHLQQGGDEHRGGQRGRLRGDVFAVASVQCRRTRQDRRAHAGLLRPVRREGRRVALLDAGEDRRHRAGARVDRPAGPRARPRGRTGWPAAGARHRAAARRNREGRRRPGRDLPAAGRACSRPCRPRSAAPRTCARRLPRRCSRSRIARPWPRCAARCRCCVAASRWRCCRGCLRGRGSRGTSLTVDLKVDRYEPSAEPSTRQEQLVAAR